MQYAMHLMRNMQYAMHLMMGYAIRNAPGGRTQGQGMQYAIHLMARYAIHLMDVVRRELRTLPMSK